MHLPIATRSWLWTRELDAATGATPGARLARLTHDLAAVRIDPTNGDALLALGLDELVEGRPDDALPHLEEARHLVATVASRVAVAEALFMRGSVDEARDAFHAALAWSPGSVRARVAMAEAERRLGNLDERSATHAPRVPSPLVIPVSPS